MRINGATPQLLAFGTAAFGDPLTAAGVTGDVVLGLGSGGRCRAVDHRRLQSADESI